MKFITLFSALALTGATQLVAQSGSWIADTVNMGTNYVNSTFYSLENGTVKQSPDSNWHIAIQAISPLLRGNNHSGVGIWTNGGAKNGYGVKLYILGKGGKSSFATLTAADTAGVAVSANLLNNDTASYAMGAFNQIAGAGQFDYGWGSYYMSDAPDGFPAHSVVGDTVYLLNLTKSVRVNNVPTVTVVKSFYIWPRSWVNENGGKWTIYAREIDGTTTDTIEGFANADHLFEYYDLVEKKWVDREPSIKDWEIQFTNYMDIYSGQGLQGVTGVIQNYDVNVAEVVETVPNDAKADTTKDSKAYQFNLNTIGSDWKKVNMQTGGFDITENLSWFIKRANGDIWQLYFDHFKTADNEAKDRLVGLQKRKVYTKPDEDTGTNNIIDITKVAATVILAPNPAFNGKVNLVIDAQEALNNAAVLITDFSGRVIRQETINLGVGFYQVPLSVSNLAKGTYVVTLLAEGKSAISQKLIVQ